MVDRRPTLRAMKPGNIKGISLIDVVKGLRANRQSALARLPDALVPYVDGSRYILASSWYPDDDFMALSEIITQIMPDPGMDPWTWLGCFGGRKAFEGPYAPLVKEGDPGESLARYPEIWRFYHDQGETIVEPAGDQGARITISHYLTTFPSFCRLQAGHMEELLRVAGATSARITVAEVGQGDEPARFDARWTLSP